MNTLAALVFSFLLQSQINQQIVVTASAVPETVETTPASVSIITRKDIDERAALNIADLLRAVPGLTLARSGSAGKQTSLFTRGAASTQTLVLWNGIQINNPYFSGFDWGRFSTAGVQRVEVVRGPYSALYGSEAMAGVVNVISAPETSHVRAELQAGGHGLRNELVDGAWSGQSLLLSAAAEHRTDEGFNANDDFRQNTGNVFAKWSPSSRLSLGLAFRHSSYNLGIPFNTNVAGTDLVPSLHRREDGRESQYSLPVSFGIFGLTNDLTLSDSKRRDNFEDPDDPFTRSTSTDSVSRRAHFTTRTGVTFLGTFAAGAEYARDTVNDVSNLGPNFLDRKRTDRALFIEDSFTKPFGNARLELTAGARHDSFYMFGSQTSPRIAAAWVMNGSKWRAAYGEGFRAPSLGELYYPFFGNADLHAERNRSFEVGYDASVGRRGLLSLTYFNSRYRDLISFDPLTFVSTNIGHVRTDGIEASLEQPLTSSMYTAISYTYLRRADDEATHERLARRPKHSGSLFLGWRSGAVDTNVVVLRTGARIDTDPVLPFGRVTDRPYTTIDANVQYRMGSVTPFVKIENLRDEKYEEVRGFASPRRRAIVGLRFGN